MFSLPEPFTGYRIHWADHIREPEFREAWDLNAGHPGGLMESRYLSALEASKPLDLAFRYGLLYAPGVSLPVARIALQVLSFSNRNFHFPKASPGTLLARLALRLRRFRVVMAGNLFSVGKPLLDCPDPRHFPALLKAAELEADRLHYDLLLLKDLPESLPEQTFVDAGYQPFDADLTMQLEVDPAWRSFEDYAQALSKKYRQRAIRVRRSGSALERRWLSPAAVRELAPDISARFRSVQDRQVVRMGVVDAQYFSELSDALGNRFRMLGYFLDGRLVGFASYIRHADELEVHYIGMDYAVNASHQLYFNILLDGIDRAIVEGFSRLELGRTAREAKAVCGCRPRHLRDRYRTQKAWVSWLLHRMSVSFTQDEGEGWQNRHPFRQASG